MECYAVMTALPFDRAAISVRFTISTAGKQSLYKKMTLLTDEYIDRKLKVSVSNLGFRRQHLLTLVTQQELCFR